MALLVVFFVIKESKDLSSCYVTKKNRYLVSWRSHLWTICFLMIRVTTTTWTEVKTLLRQVPRRKMRRFLCFPLTSLLQPTSTELKIASPFSWNNLFTLYIAIGESLTTLTWGLSSVDLVEIINHNARLLGIQSLFFPQVTTQICLEYSLW